MWVFAEGGMALNDYLAANPQPGGSPFVAPRQTPYPTNSQSELPTFPTRGKAFFYYPSLIPNT